LWAAAEIERATFDAQPVARGAGHRLGVVLVVGVLATMVGSGLVSRAAPGGPRIEGLAVAARESPAQAANQPALPHSPVDPRPGSAVNLRWPRTGDALTGATVAIKGTLRVRAANVEIVLEGRARQTLASQVVDTTDPDGGVRPLRTPAIDVELPIPTPRPVGRLWVVITAYDGFGSPIGTMYRLIQVGELSLIGRPPSGPPVAGDPAAAGRASRRAPTTSS
jgi:hypothetical protein